jgi:hypothetical protein
MYNDKPQMEALGSCARMRGVIEELEGRRNSLRCDLEAVDKALAIFRAQPGIAEALDALRDATGRIL